MYLVSPIKRIGLELQEGRFLVMLTMEKVFKTGFQSEFDIFRTEGNLSGIVVGHDFANTTLDINDLGVNFRNNYNNFVAGVSYEIFEPSKIV